MGISPVELSRQLLRRSFKIFAAQAMPELVWHRHIHALADVIQRIGDGTLKRVIVMMPPRMGKSLLASRLLPGWWLCRRPQSDVGLTTYGQELSSRLIQDGALYLANVGARLKSESALKWTTFEGGELWAAGVGGAITGRGGDLIIVDDPIKGRKEADSPTQRESVNQWFRSTLYSRLHPEAALLVIGTRWHEHDLIGVLLDQEKTSETTEGWHIVFFDHEHDPATRDSRIPDSCTVEPDWRAEGELLCPARYDAAAVARMKVTMGSREWAALHQGTPMPPGGLMFRHDWLRFLEVAPASTRKLRYWDLAGTEDRGDFTAGVLIARTADGWCIEDVVRGQWSPFHRRQQIVATAQRDGRGVNIWIEADAGVGGADRTQSLIAALAGFNVRAERPTGSKTLRAEPLAAQCEAGNVAILERPWTHAFVEELLAFPSGQHDDQVDAAAAAFMKVSETGRAKVVAGPWSFGG